MEAPSMAASTNGWLLSLLLDHKVSIREHDLMGKWLGTLDYIYPKDRVCHPSIWECAGMIPKSRLAAMEASMIGYVVEVHYSEKEQIEAAKITIDKLPNCR